MILVLVKLLRRLALPVSVLLAFVLAVIVLGGGDEAARDSGLKTGRLDTGYDKLPASERWSEPETGVIPGMTVQRDQHDKRIRRARGFYPGARGAFQQAAESFLRHNSQALGLSGDLGELRRARAFSSPSSNNVVYDQVYAGRKVFDGWLSVHMSKSGGVQLVNSDLVPIAREGDMAFRYSASQAAEAAVGYSPANSAPKGQPMVEEGILVQDGVAEGAFRVSYVTSDPPADWEVSLRASDLSLVSIRNKAQYVDGQGMVFRINPCLTSGIPSLTDNNDADSAQLNNERISVTIPGLDGSGFLQGPYASTAPTSTQARANEPSLQFNYTRSDNRFEEVMSYYYTDKAERYIQSLGFMNINNRVVGIDVNGTTADNSFYSPSTKNVTFGTGGVDDAEDSDVIYHELGHAIQDNQVPGWGATEEGGAMGEAFGDYWAGSESAGVGPQSPGWDPYIAEWDATSYNPGNPAYLRILNSTKHYPEDMVGQVHADGEIWSATLWQIRALIGRARADKLFLDAHFRLTPSANFVDGANAILQSNQALYGGQDQQGIRIIFANRGILQLVNKPTNLQATPVSSTRINLTWVDNSGNEDGFRIERKQGAGAFAEIATVGVNAQSYSDMGLQPDTSYTYRVRAYSNSEGNSSYSNEAGATTPNQTYTISGRVTFRGMPLKNNVVQGIGNGVFSVVQTLNPGTTIPDNNTTGITSNMTISDVGTLTDIKVGVDITHTWIGDLEVSIIHPDGTAVILHNRTGGSSDNLITSYPDLTTPAQSLAVLLGRPSQGVWKLKVRDLAAQDIGTLNSWKLTLKYNGTKTVTIKTDGSGNYSLANLFAATYTVKPLLTSVRAAIFTPAQRVITVGPDASGQDFSGQ